MTAKPTAAQQHTKSAAQHTKSTAQNTKVTNVTCWNCSKSVSNGPKELFLGRTYHKTCLKCTSCDELLKRTTSREKQPVEFEKLPHCQDCYDKLNKLRKQQFDEVSSQPVNCDGCSVRISQGKDGAVYACGRYYHQTCLKCARCHAVITPDVAHEDKQSGVVCFRCPDTKQSEVEAPSTLTGTGTNTQTGTGTGTGFTTGTGTTTGTSTGTGTGPSIENERRVRCALCNNRVFERLTTAHGGKVYCKERCLPGKVEWNMPDYKRMPQKRPTRICYICKRNISNGENVFVALGWAHDRCMTCKTCDASTEVHQRIFDEEGYCYCSVPCYNLYNGRPMTKSSSSNFLKSGKSSKWLIDTNCKACRKDGDIDEMVRVKDARWHRDCLKCAQCGNNITLAIAFHDGQHYCLQPCYESILRPTSRCQRCQKTQFQDDMVKYIDKYFHYECFNCDLCRERLDVSRVVTNGISLFCDNQCLREAIEKPCIVCEKEFNSMDGFVTISDQRYHRDCLKCNSCGKHLTMEGTSVYELRPYCNEPCFRQVQATHSQLHSVQQPQERSRSRDVSALESINLDDISVNIDSQLERESMRTKTQTLPKSKENAQSRGAGKTANLEENRESREESASHAQETIDTVDDEDNSEVTPFAMLDNKSENEDSSLRY